MNVLSPRRTIFRTACLALALGAWLAALAACGNAPAPAADVPPPATGSPGIRGAESGLEMLWWIVLDDGETIPRLLGPHAQSPLPVPAPARALWEANGLRIVGVPAGDVDALGSDLHPVGPVHRQWLGECPRWTDAVRGPVWAGPKALDLDNGPLVLDPGRLRLLLRSWVVPAGWSPGRVVPGLRVELALQHVPAEPTARDWLRGSSPRAVPPADEEGLVFSRLVLEFVASPDRALVIVPEQPDVRWGEDPGPSGPAESTESARRFGPRPDPSSTLGETLLTLEQPEPVAAEGGPATVQLIHRRAKAIVVLIPRVPGSVSLAAASE